MSIGEVWELVKLLNRELKNTRLNLDASEQVSPSYRVHTHIAKRI